MFPGQPLLFPGVAKQWPVMKSWTLDGLATRLAGEQVEFMSYGCSGGEDSVEEEEEEEMEDDGAEEPQEVVDQEKAAAKGCKYRTGDAGHFFGNLSRVRGVVPGRHAAGLQVLMLREDEDMLMRRPDLMRELSSFQGLFPIKEFQKLGYRFRPALWAGPGNATTGLHADLDAAIFLIHMGPGTKHVVFLPPSAAQALQATRITEGGQYAPFLMDLFARSVTTDFPSTMALRDHPQLMTLTLHPGDVLYVPCGWFHQVEYVEEPSVSVSLVFDHENQEYTLQGCQRHRPDT